MEEILPVVYDQLRRMAARKLRDERTSHTLSATALVHEAWLELTKLNRIEWQNHSHYLAVAAQAMRRILVDYAVARRRQKRGGGQALVPLDDDVLAVVEARGEELLALDEALVRLAAMNERQARIVEYRFYGGMSVEETAGLLHVSPATVKREWATARAWLNRELQA
jgi:RNA polymerase sigma factor (TIGR02999 family)